MSTPCPVVVEVLRPVTWRGAPQEVFPPEPTDDFRGIPRRIDGVLRLPE